MLELRFAGTLRIVRGRSRRILSGSDEGTYVHAPDSPKMDQPAGDVFIQRTGNSMVFPNMDAACAKSCKSFASGLKHRQNDQV